MNPPAGFKEALVKVGLTLALFLSGFFVILTPLPLLYSFLGGGLRRFLHVAGSVFLLLSFLYIFLAPHLHSFYSQHPQWSWLLSIPGLPFTGFIRQEMITFFGLVSYLFYFGVAMVSGFALVSKKGPFPLIFMASLIIFVVCGAVFSTMGYIERSGLSTFAKDQFNMVLTELSSLQADGVKASENILYIKNNLGRLAFYFLWLTPSLFFDYVLLVVVLNVGLGRRLFNKLIPQDSNGIKLNLWSTPFFGVWLVIAGLAGYLGHVYFFKQEIMALIAGNVLIVMVLLYYLQGLAVISHFFEKKNIAPFTRTLTYLMILLLFQTVGVVVVALGFFDSWFNFRRIAVQETQK